MYSEKLVIEDLFQETETQKIDLSQSLRFYEKWKLTIESSNIAFLKKYLHQQNSLLSNIQKPLHANMDQKIVIDSCSNSPNGSEKFFEIENTPEKFYEAETYFEADEKLEDKSENIEVNEHDEKEAQKPNESIEEEVITHQDIKKDISIKQIAGNKDEKSTNVKEIVENKSIMEINSSSGMNVDSIGEPSEFIKCIDKLTLSTQTVEKHLENIQRPNKEFYEFEKQDLKLNAIKQTLESLSTALKTSMLHKNVILVKSDEATALKITESVSSLMEMHQNCTKKYAEKQKSYSENREKWVGHARDYDAMKKWLDLTLAKFKNLKQMPDLDKDKINEIVQVII